MNTGMTTSLRLNFMEPLELAAHLVEFSPAPPFGPQHLQWEPANRTTQMSQVLLLPDGRSMRVMKNDAETWIQGDDCVYRCLTPEALAQELAKL